MARPHDDISWLPDDGLTEAMRRLGGTPPEVLANPELMALVLPTVRADFRLLETYRPATRRPLPCPVVSYRYTEDREVRPEAAARWAELTSAGVAHRDLPGGHFAITEQPGPLIARVAEDLDHHLG